MTPLANAPDFEPALADLQDHLPFWWRTQDPTSELYKLLTGVGSVIDMLSALWEAPYLDQVLTTASPAGLMRNAQLAFGLMNEQVSSVQSLLVRYIQLLASDDGSLQAATNALTALLTIPAGATLTAEPEVNGVPNPSFEHDTPGGAPAGWSTSAFSLNAGSVLTVNAAGGVQGPQYMNIVTTAALASEGASAGYPDIPGGNFLAGQPYTAGVWLIGAVGGEQVQLLLGATADDSAGVNITLTTSWALYTVTWTPSANRAGATHGLAVRTQTATAMTFRADGAMIVPGNVLQPYGDGDSPGWYWTGTPGNSASAQHGIDDPPLIFPADGSGLHFPADGSGLTFGVFPLLYINMSYSTYTMTVYVLNWLSFDRPTFAREVQRFVPADWNAATVVEVPILPWTISQLEGTYLTVSAVEAAFATVTNVENDVTP